MSQKGKNPALARYYKSQGMLIKHWNHPRSFATFVGWWLFVTSLYLRDGALAARISTLFAGVVRGRDNPAAQDGLLKACWRYREIWTGGFINKYMQMEATEIGWCLVVVGKRILQKNLDIFCLFGQCLVSSFWLISILSNEQKGLDDRHNIRAEKC